MHTIRLELTVETCERASILHRYNICVAMLAVATVWLHGKTEGLDLATEVRVRERFSVNFTEMWVVAGALPAPFGLARLKGDPSENQSVRAGSIWLRDQRQNPCPNSGPTGGECADLLTRSGYARDAD